jgi:hypothetical protein
VVNDRFSTATHNALNELEHVVTRSISGHATEHMQRLYSTVTNQEQAASLTRILDMMPPPLPALPSPEGEHLGEHARGR